MKVYAPSLSLAEARRQYFVENGFGPNGGYDDAWVDFKFGPIPFPFPNTPPRVRAVKYHDLHHLVTGYETTFLGESEIAAWEIGSGCADMIAAWQLNLGGMAMGLLLAPRRTWRAFLRGRRSKNFYRERFDDALLSMTIGDARSRLGLDEERQPPATPVDVLLFAVACGSGLLLSAISLVLFTPLALLAVLPLRLVAGRSRKTQ